jgi:hypothetical protein
MKLPWLLCGILALSAHSFAQDQTQFAGVLSGPRIEMVIVSADVVDRKHRPANGLEAKDFTIYEDGQVQKLSHYCVPQEDTPGN